MSLPRLLIFASGTKTGGGSGFKNLVEASRDGRLDAEIVGVVSNHADGGVRQKADALGVPFRHFPGPWVAGEYQYIAMEFGAEFFALSGWLKLVCGLDPKSPFNSRTVFNIHPGPLPRFGGPGLYGHHVHEAVIEAFQRGELEYSAVSMHFVTEKYDEGPKFLNVLVPIQHGDTADTLALRVNTAEHRWQPYITNLVVQGKIHWDGVNPLSLVCPDYHLD